MTNIIPVTYGYARVSKADDANRNLETQVHILQELGIRKGHIFAGEVTGSSRSRPAWNELMTRVRPRVTVVVPRFDRVRRNFDERVRIQGELIKGEHRRRGNQVNASTLQTTVRRSGPPAE